MKVSLQMKTCSTCGYSGTSFYSGHDTCRFCDKKAALGRVIPPDHKYCPKCKQVLKHREFTKARRRSDGLKAWCRECFNATERERTTPEKHQQKYMRRKAKQ